MLKLGDFVHSTMKKNQWTDDFKVIEAYITIEKIGHQIG